MVLNYLEIFSLFMADDALLSGPVCVCVSIVRMGRIVLHSATS